MFKCYILVTRTLIYYGLEQITVLKLHLAIALRQIIFNGNFCHPEFSLAFIRVEKALMFFKTMRFFNMASNKLFHYHQLYRTVTVRCYLTSSLRYMILILQCMPYID